jgi:hypothetical protein
MYYFINITQLKLQAGCGFVLIFFVFFFAHIAKI